MILKSQIHEKLKFGFFLTSTNLHYFLRWKSCKIYDFSLPGRHHLKMSNKKGKRDENTHQKTKVHR